MFISCVTAWKAPYKHSDPCPLVCPYTTDHSYARAPQHTREPECHSPLVCPSVTAHSCARVPPPTRVPECYSPLVCPSATAHSCAPVAV